MAKVVVENVKGEMNEEMMPMRIGKDEMMELIKKLPDWGREVRKIMAKKYKGYKYWRDGVRIDEEFNLMKKEGDRQWFLKYYSYRICGKEKRTRFRTVLHCAYCIDSMGRIGTTINEDAWRREINKYEIAYCSKNGSLKIPPVEGDVIEALKYSRLANYFEGMGRICMENLLMYSAMYIRFPQVEFIYKLEDQHLRDIVIGRLLNMFKEEEFQELKDWINIIRLCLKHKYHLFENYMRNSIFNNYGRSIWWDYIKGIRMLGKDWRNPHYLFPDDLRNAHDRVLMKLEEKFPETVNVDVEDQKMFNRLKRRYVGMVFKEGDLIIMTLDSPQAYIAESRAMHNCIESWKFYLKSTSLILCARLKGKRIADIELSLIDYRIIQCCGPCNRITSKRNEIEALIEKNIPEIQRRQFIRIGKKTIDSAA